MTDRLPVHAIDTAGGVAGQVPTINLAGTALEYVTPSAGGGSGGTGRDRRWNAPVTATVIDEFNDDSLAAAWVRVDGTGAPAGNVAWTEGADVLSMVQSAGDTSGAAGHALVRPLSSSVAVGDAFTAGVQLLVPSTANFPSFGIILADGITFGSGSQVIGAVSNSTGATEHFPSTWDYSGFNTRNAFTAAAFTFMRGIYVHLRLVRTSAGWRTDLSADGIGWVIGTALVKTITPTHVGLFATTFGQSATKFAASVDYLRRFSGVS